MGSVVGSPSSADRPERPSASNDAPAPGTLATLGLWTFVAGLALGLFQPLAVVGVGATVVAGPSYAGLLFLLCVLLALVMGALAFFGARWFTAPAFVACAALAFGLFVGNWAAASFGIGFASNRQAAVRPTFTLPPMPLIREAPATVVLRLEGVPGFVPNAGEQRFTSVDAAGNVVADGVFGQWCFSGPDTEAIASIETIDVGKLGQQTVWAELRLMAPGGLPMSMALPRVQIRLVEPDGSVPSMWTGQGQVEAMDRTSGRVVFTDLAPDIGGAGPATLTGAFSWTCSNWPDSAP
jgi:hypothetical protein